MEWNEMKRSCGNCGKTCPKGIIVTNCKTAETNHTINGLAENAEKRAPFSESPYRKRQKQLLLVLYDKVGIT
jgi:Fe-S-cluster-containing hydrogenase component 2